MEQFDNLPNDLGTEAPQSVEATLQTLTQDLRNLQKNISGQLSQDVERLQREKARLIQDIEALQGEYQSLQTEYESLQSEHKAALSSQQLAQQQVWAKRLAQALATHLQARLSHSLYPPNGDPATLGATQPSPHNATVSGFHNPVENAYQLLSSLDSTLNGALQSLQQDLNGYQSSLSQQISRMHSMERQGEAILEALVNRLSQQLQTELARPQTLNPPLSENGYDGVLPHRLPHPNIQTPTPTLPQPQPRQPQARQPEVRPSALGRPQASPSPSALKKKVGELSNIQKGLILIIFSTLALSIHNVLVGVIGYGGRIFGLLPIDSVLQLNFPNSLLLLWLRMVIVLLLTPLMASRLYPPVWRDIRRFFAARHRRSLFQVIGSGCFLFLSQVSIYMAISEVGPGVAVTLLFMYPLITVPLAWFVFGDRPTPLRFVVMIAILMGVVFTALPGTNSDFLDGGVYIAGIVMALFSGCTFALYLISMKMSAGKLHPAPMMLFQFATIFLLTSLLLVIRPFGGQVVQPASLPALVVSGFLLGGLTLLGYLFGDYGMRLMGAAKVKAAAIAAGVPVITAILAIVITPGEITPGEITLDDKSTLEIVQWVGIILVTIGAIALELEQIAAQQKASKKTSRR